MRPSEPTPVASTNGTRTRYEFALYREEARVGLIVAVRRSVTWHLIATSPGALSDLTVSCQPDPPTIEEVAKLARRLSTLFPGDESIPLIPRVLA